MPILTLDQACLAFGHVALLDHASLQIDAGERVCLVGRNGGGKSSLLRVMAGELALDEGVAWRSLDMKIGYVAQEPVFLGASNVFEAVAQGVGEVSALVVAYHEVLHRVAIDHRQELLDLLHEHQSELERVDGWRYNTRVEQTLTQLGLDGSTALDTLSGGGLKRVALARALVAEPALLLLDEPTNHLDLDAIRWLEEFLCALKGAVVVVTHDRRFVDAIATRIVELDRGRLTNFPGSFSDYERRKSELRDVQARQNERFDKLLAQEEAWIRRGIEARRTRNEGRVRRLEQLRRERAARRERLGTASMHLSRGESSGRLVAELERVTKRFGDQTVVRDFSCRVLRGDRIGVVGPNGAGKTTLLKLILGTLAPDEGSVRLGTKLRVAYHDQLRTALEEEASLADVISQGAEYVDVGGVRKHVISYLGDFLFPPQRARSPVKSLSGGERNRLLLARLFSKAANVLVLDEPTNDLDIETLELLEALLQDYDGTVLLVTHDRAFLDNVVTQVIAAEGAGVWREYAGGYDEWARSQRGRAESAACRNVRPGSESMPRRAASDGKPRVRLNFSERRELEALPDKIELLEQDYRAVSTRLEDPEVYRDAPQEVAKLKDRLTVLECQIDEAMRRWDELERRSP